MLLAILYKKRIIHRMGKEQATEKSCQSFEYRLRNTHHLSVTRNVDK
jgi:hypothetical protein